MFLAERVRASRLLMVGVAIAMVTVTTLVSSAPAQADETYPRPWDNTVTLSGHGYGHGHGMSQWGAYGAATKGSTWQAILGFYYPGTVLANLGNPTIRVRLDAVGPGILYVSNKTGLELVGKPMPATLGGAAISQYRVRTLADGVMVVEGRSSAGWKHYTYTAFPAVFSNPSLGSIVDVIASVRQPDGTTKRAWRTYRGSIVANWLTSASITPVSVLPMETYLRAVVPAEMPSSWKPAALAAQAVAARSYANNDRASARAGRIYDTCDTTSCQMYSGVPAEAATTDAAIAATAGQTLTYLGEPAFTQFSAANGGYSVAGSQPYLVAKADPYDGVVPNSANAWTKTVTVAAIEAKWPSIGTYRQLRIISRDGHGQWGGRVLTAAIDGSAGSVTVTGETLRSALGLKSEWFIPTNPGSAPSYPRDFTGDRLADIAAVLASNGDLRMYAGNGASGAKSVSVIGTGFGGFLKVFTAGTWDDDAISDVMVQKSDGSLWLYPGTAAGPLGPSRQVGTGWGVYDLVFPVGDFGGDGLSDLLARRPDGGLVLYSGDGAGGFLNNTRQIGAGWDIFTSVFSPGDFDGDGRSDIIARTSDGLLYLYPGNGTGGAFPRRRIGYGWNVLSTIFSVGDFNGDGKSDVLGRGWDGTLWMYTGNGTGGFLQKKAVGAGWNIFMRILP
ncbi:MAG: SpoIID/LytB domain-containing protein [Phycicoccus sp.]|nr:SpoIID/LytB domain-containing protein [Phycicoccus sp.]